MKGDLHIDSGSGKIVFTPEGSGLKILITRLPKPIPERGFLEIVHLIGTNWKGKMKAYVIIGHSASGIAEIFAVVQGSLDPRELFEVWWQKNVTDIIGPPPTGGDSAAFRHWLMLKQGVIKKMIGENNTFQRMIVNWLVKDHQFVELEFEELNFSQGFV